MIALVLLCSLLLQAGCSDDKPRGHNTRITIDSEPVQGAQVLLSGVSQGETPVTISGLAPGYHEVLLKKEDYRRAFDRIQVKENAPETFTIKLEPLSGYLSVESKPRDAIVRLSTGEELGKTPISRHTLPIGEYTYEVSLESHYPQTKTLSVEEDFQYKFHHELKPMEATLAVRSRPTGAEVYLNGELQTGNTPTNVKLPPGHYLVTVRSKGFIEEEARIDLAAFGAEEILLEMKPGVVPPGMALVPEGKFLMGAKERAPDESPRRNIHLNAYYIDKYEVSNADFKKVFPSFKYPTGQDRIPVTGVSWNQATDYATALGKRLPTEAEWEKAARGSDGRDFPWGDKFDGTFCITEETGVLARVGTNIAGISPHGCMDMSGNAYEWTQDWYQAYPGNETIVKDYGQVFRVLRGGSYMTGQFEARCARRHFAKMDDTRADYGFRCVADISSSDK